MSCSKWREVRVFEIGQVVTGKTPSSKIPNQFGKLLPFVTPTDFRDYHKWVFEAERYLSDDGVSRLPGKVLPKKSVLVTCIGSDMGKVAITGVQCVTNQQINSIIPFTDKIDANFLFYTLTSMHDDLQQLARGGTTMPIINKGAFEKICVRSPSLAEQKAIAATLSCLDDKIELNNRINKTLEEMAQAIFKSWFVDFEPFQDGEFEDSELGPIPKGWRVGCIYEVCDVIYGAPFQSKLFNEDGKGFPLIRIRDLKTFNPQFYTDENHPKAEIVNLGDILVGMDAEFRPCVWKGTKGLLNQRVCKFVPKHDHISKYYVYHVIKPHMEYIENYKVGTTVSHIGKKDIDKIQVISPPKDVLAEFKKCIDSIYAGVLSNSRQNQVLSGIRDALLPKLMSGEIRVPIEEVQ